MERSAGEIEVVVIGAGLSGLGVARELVRAGQIVKLIDKSRGAGGRIATRRFGEVAFDYGSLTLGFEFGPIPSAGGRHAIRATFAHVLPLVETETRAVAIACDSDGTVMTSLEDGRHLRSRRVVVALPAPQAHTLLESIDGSAELASVPYDVVVAVVLGISGDDRVRRTWRTDFLCESPEEREKPDTHWRTLAEARLANERGESAGTSVTEALVHRWRYARPLRRLAGTHRSLADGRVCVVGDYFDAGTEPVEATLASARACAVDLRTRTA